MINKLTSVHEIIAKVVRDFGLGDDEIRWQDMIEWIAEGLVLIGAYTQFEEKEAIIAIENHKGVLPCDFHRSIRFMKGCSFGDNLGGPYWEVVKTILTDSGFYDTNADGTVSEGDVYDTLDPLTFQKLQLVQYSRTGYGGDKVYGNISRVSNLMGNGVTYTGLDNSYQVNFDTVTASFRYGFISLRYLAIPVDSSGYPKVPDDASFKEALMWRCAAKLAQRGYQFKNPMWNDFERGNMYWNKYCLQARGAANAPDNDTMQRLANIWNTLIPNQGRYYEDFNSLGKPDFINHNGPAINSARY